MAFSSQEKAKILYFLGYPSKVSDPYSIEYNSIVMSRFENVPLDSEELIRGLIAEIETLKAKLTKSHCTMGTKQVGDIALNPDNVGSNLKVELKRLYCELSQLINIRYIGKMGRGSVRIRY